MNTNNCIYFILLLCLSVHSKTKDKFLDVQEKLNNNNSYIKHDKRIRNGQNIDITAANYYVYVICHQSHCGGTLVKQNKVVTAGHCVDSCTSSQFQIAVGLNDLSQLSQAKKYRANSIRLHPRYNKQHPFPYDVAVITLSQNVALNDKVGTINYVREIPPLLRTLTVVGYGFINTKGQQPRKLQRGQVRIVKKDRTQLFTQALIGSSVLPGDSGGPAIYNNQLAGIISGTRSLNNIIFQNLFVAVGHPDIYDFIRDNM
nr:chymotrypsin-2-like [Onthophagus taurus]XP_022908540.1 chymotrypsin-2-like [Onthophagus taurus]